MAEKSQIEKFATAGKIQREAMGSHNPQVDTIAQAINKVAGEYNVLISYDISELPTHGGSQRAAQCHCVCVCSR